MDDSLQRDIKNSHDYDKYLKRKCQGLGDILSVAEVTVEFNKELTTCSGRGPELWTHSSFLP